MGLVHVDVEVSREGGPTRTVRFLVDSGAAYSVLSRDDWQALGLVPTRRMDFVLADGTTIQRDVSHCLFTYQGVRAPSPVVLGEAQDDALLGSVTLENLGLVLNPFDRTLRPMRLRLAAVGIGRGSRAPAHQTQGEVEVSREGGCRRADAKARNGMLQRNVAGHRSG
jgi:predicted aspartyl protease